MRKYRITVNGRSYEVEVEDLGGTAGPVVASVSRAAAPAAPAPQVAPPPPRAVAAPAEAVVVAPVRKPVASAGDAVIPSPLPGVVMKVLVQKGQRCARGAVLLTIEAMKMENEIMAPHDGVVEEVFVTPNQSVQTGAPLLKIAKA